MNDRPSTGTTAPHLVVVGGGITGLAAAWQASSDPDVRVTVLEASDRLGGKLRTSPIELDDGSSLLIDEGADAFLIRVPDAVDLCRELGLADELTNPAVSRAKVWSDGSLKYLPEHTVLGVPLDLTALEAAAVLSEQGLADVAAEAGEEREPLDGDVAIGEFLRERFGAELVERIVGPLIGGINAGDIDRLSLLAVTPQLAEAAREGGSLTDRLREHRAASTGDTPVFATPRSGTAAMVTALVQQLGARGVELVRSCPVSKLEASGRGAWSLVLEGSGSAVDADSVVITTAASPASRLLDDTAPGAAAELASIRSSSVTLVTFVYRSADVEALDASGFLVPRSAGLLMTAASWGSTKWAHWNDGRHVVLRVSAGRDGDDRHLAMDDGELVRALRNDLETTTGIVEPPAAARVTRWPDGFAQYGVGHLDRVERIEAALAEEAPGVAVAGAAYRGLGIPACIRQGRRAAMQLMTS